MTLLLVILVTLALIVMTVTAIVNAVTFPRLRRVDYQAVKVVSVLVPARNEGAVIGDTVRALLAQDEADEILLLDDHSTDGTADTARAAANGDPRFRVITGAPLPAGWLGKHWACHQLAQAARGDLLIFTDADVGWKPGALRAVCSEIARTGADLLTVWSTQQTVTLGERLVVPLMAFVIHAYLPALLVHHTRWSSLAAANGQCLAFERAVYYAIGGHAAARASIVDDIALARAVKRHGYKLRMVDGSGRITCRMYTSWHAARDGYAKNIIAGYGDSVPALVLAAVFHWLVFLAPLAWLFVPGLTAWAAVLIALGTGVRALTAAVTRQRVMDALLMPVSVLLMTRIAGQALWWRWRFGGPQWKGRTLARAALVPTE